MPGRSGWVGSSDFRMFRVGPRIMRIFLDEENLNGIYHGDISHHHILSLVISCYIIIPVYHIVDHWFAEDLTNEALQGMNDRRKLFGVCWNHQPLYDLTYNQIHLPISLWKRWNTMCLDQFIQTESNTPGWFYCGGAILTTSDHFSAGDP